MVDFDTYSVLHYIGAITVYRQAESSQLVFVVKKPDMNDVLYSSIVVFCSQKTPLFTTGYSKQGHVTSSTTEKILHIAESEATKWWKWGVDSETIEVIKIENEWWNYSAVQGIFLKSDLNPDFCVLSICFSTDFKRMCLLSE